MDIPRLVGIEGVTAISDMDDPGYADIEYCTIPEECKATLFFEDKREPEEWMANISSGGLITMVWRTLDGKHQAMHRKSQLHEYGVYRIVLHSTYEIDV